MLEVTRPYGEALRPFLSAQIDYGPAREAWEFDGYWSLRRSVFCEEQRLFASADDECDADDVHALPIVAVAHSAGTPERVVGTVRIFERDSGTWYGGRLAVDTHYRARGSVGAHLIEAAVVSALGHGCVCFLATVLAQNARYFERFHFRPERALSVCGQPHVLMRAELSAYDVGRIG